MSEIKRLTSNEPEFLNDWYERGISSQDVEGEPVGNQAYMAWMREVLYAATPRKIDWAQVELAIILDRSVRRDEVRREDLGPLAVIAALHQPGYRDVAGVWHDHTVLMGSESLPKDHVCRTAGYDICDPEGDEHWVLACAECRGVADEGDVGYPVWPCPTAAALIKATTVEAATGDSA